MPHSLNQLLNKIMGEKAPGPSLTFSMFHIIRAIELIAEKTVGRNKLADGLEVGPGAVRTMISRLKAFGMITTSKRGCALSNRGLKFWRQYKKVFRRKVGLVKSGLTLADHNVAILVKNHGQKVKSGIEQRDAAIKVGARGATTIICKGGRLTIPFVSDNVANDYPKAASQIIRFLQPEDNDVIVIGSAESFAKAEYGVLAAAWTLIDDVV